MGQYLMFCVEDDAPTGVTPNPFGVSSNTEFTLCCLDEGDNDACLPLNLVADQVSLAEHAVCVIDGNPIQFNYYRFIVPEEQNCGIYYIKITAYVGTPQERVFYSQPIEIYSPEKARQYKLLKLNINDTCSVGGINWSEIFPGWNFIDGLEVYLPRDVSSSFVEEVSDEEVEEDGKGNEIKIFEKTDWRYELDTGFVPDHYAEIIKELSHTNNNSITVMDRQADHKYNIGRARTTMTPDGDGCYLNVNVNYLVNTYSSDSCCDTQECECPSDNSIQAISYTTDQVDAEISVNEGDTYLVPNLGAVGPNPDWNVQDNNIAVWNGSDWDYSPNTIGLYAYVDDAGTNYMSLGVGDVWTPNDAWITSIIENGGGTCTVDVIGVIPIGTWAKIQISPAGLGSWTDMDGVFYDLNDWQSGQTFSVGIAGNYDFRLVHLNTGCSLNPSPIFNLTTTETCI